MNPLKAWNAKLEAASFFCYLKTIQAVCIEVVLLCIFQERLDLLLQQEISLMSMFNRPNLIFFFGVVQEDPQLNQGLLI